MTISSTTDRVSFEGNGVTTSFPLPFRFFSNSDIQASLIDDETGVATLLSFGVDYTLLGAGAPEQAGSTESVLDATAAPPTGKTLFVQRVMEIVQPTDIVNQGRFFPEVHETVFDRLTMLVQQAALGPSRTIRVPESDPISGRLPSADARATKVFGFDENGDPVVSSLSLSAIEGQVPLAQGFAQASAASASEASGYAEDADLFAQASAASAVQSGEFRDEAEAIADSLTGAAVPLFSVMWCPSRLIVPAGYAVADGQTLSRITYPDAWAAAQVAGLVVTDAVWLADPTKRGFYSSGDGSTTFRLPDYNGKFAGSLGAVFLRGDGALSAGAAGVIQQDALKSHAHSLQVRSDNGALLSNLSGGVGAQGVVQGGTWVEATLYAPLPAGSSETRPLNVTGCWVIKLFGAVVNVGSADAAQLASDYANLDAALQTFASRYDSEVDFTIIYPNGGSAGSPANVVINTRYVVDNPFPGYNVICVAEINISGVWASVGWSSALAASTASHGTTAGHITGVDKIIVLTGTNGVYAASATTGGLHGYPGPAIGSGTCRVKVWKVKGAIV